MLDTALWKLPRALADALGPQQLAGRVTDDNAYVEPETFGVDHERKPSKNQCGIVSHMPLSIQSASPARPKYFNKYRGLHC
jgi:hypothetical protein